MSSVFALLPSLSSPYTLSFTILALLSSLLSMGFLTRRTPLDVKDKHCYIGGGSEGLGLSLAKQLAEKGAHVTIVSRSQAKLDKALAEIETHRQSPTQVLQAFSCDLTSSASAASTLRTACSHSSLPSSGASPAPDFIFACAGGSFPDWFLTTSPDDHWKCMEWNFRTCLNTVHEGVKAMRESGKKGGRVVLVGSVLSMMSFAGYSNYSPSKYAIRGLAEALRSELLLYHISVHLFLPATIFTPGFEVEMQSKPDITKKIEGPDEGMKPDEVARELIKGLERNDFYITYEPVGHMLRTSRGITPRNNILLDQFWGVIGSIGFPIWRWMSSDGEVLKERQRVEKEAAAAGKRS